MTKTATRMLRLMDRDRTLLRPMTKTAARMLRLMDRDRTLLRP